MKRVDIIEPLERRNYFNQIVFAEPVPFPTGNKPSDLVAADLTNNGRIDIVTSNLDSASISVLRGNGNGTFQPPVAYPTDSAPQALVVGDLNGDGIPDIVTANEQGNSVSVLLGVGDGTFRPQVSYPVQVRPLAIAVADLTGNGRLDIVTANEGSDSVSVLLNNGDGTYQPAINYLVGSQPDGVALADLNGDEHPDIVVVTPTNNNLHVLLNQNDGTFGVATAYATGLEGRSITVADLNSDGRPDIVTTNLHSTNISLLPGIGDGTFQAQQNYGTGVFPFSVTIADVNGDGRPDVITANNFDNAIGVLLRNGSGGFTVDKQFKAGVGPVASVVADVNGDGKADIIAADFNTSTISVLLNQTVFVPLIPTKITLTPGQNPVQSRNRLVLTAQITPTAFTKQKPIGVVQFFNGDAVIGVGTVSSSGIARVSTMNLSTGIHTITAHYGGDSFYAGSFAAAVSEAVIPPAQAVPFVSPSISAVHLPTAYVPGDRGVADVLITDNGAGTAVGTAGVQLYASTSTAFDATAFALSSAQVRLNLPGGRSRLVGISFTMPATIQPGNYTIFTALAPVSGLTSAQVSAIPAVGLTTQQSVLQFGAVGVHRNYRLTRTLSTGASVTLSLSGPGTGGLTENADGSISVGLVRTNGQTTLSISGDVTLDSLTSVTTVGTVNARTVNLNGTLSLSGSVGRLALGNASNSSIFLGGGAPNIISLGAVSNTSLYSAAPIRSLTVGSYANQPGDAVTTAWITTLRCTGDFGPSLMINGGVGGRDLSIKAAVIGGSLLNSTWSIQANVGTVQAGNIAGGWSGSIHGMLDSLIDTGSFAGELAVHNIGSILINGDLTDADILAGADFGADARLGGNNDTFGRGILTSIKVLGNVSNAVVAAGLAPLGSNLLAPGVTLQPKSAVRNVFIGGTIDSATRFLAVSLPAKAILTGNSITTAGDPNFSL